MHKRVHAGQFSLLSAKESSRHAERKLSFLKLSLLYFFFLFLVLLGYIPTNILINKYISDPAYNIAEATNLLVA